MPIRFRKTFQIFPGVKINASKHGISATVGPRGMHLTFNRFGVRQSVGIPGTGLSETSYIVGGNRGSEAEGSEEAAAARHHSIHHGEGVGCQLPGCGCFILLLLIVGVLLYFGADGLHLIPANYSFSHLLQAVAQWAHKSGF